MSLRMNPLVPPKASDKIELTDANMTIANDWSDHITVIIDNDSTMGQSFPSPVNLDSGATASGYIQASPWYVPGQSSFDITFHSGHKMTIDIGTGLYVTDASPPAFADGTVGAVLAPGQPFSTGTDFNFLFFDGPGILPPLINSFVQANLPAIISSINATGITIKVSDSISFNISTLQLDPSSVVCTYAGALPSEDANVWNANVVVSVGAATIVGSETISDQTGSLNLSITSLVLYAQVAFDTTFATKPKVKALQCSLDDYSLSGTLLAILEVLFPEIAALVALGATAYRVAGFINTTFNQQIIDAINSAIGNVLNPAVAVGKADPAKDMGSPPSSLAPSPTADLSTWMSTPQMQAKTLGQIKLPATHDSATYGLTSTLSQIAYPDIQFLWYLSDQAAPANNTWPVTVPPTAANPAYLGSYLYDFVMSVGVGSAARTQDLTILQQLQSGIRSFDFRVYFDTRDNSFYIQHALRGPLFQDVLSQMQMFLQANPTSGELILATISHTNLQGYPDQIAALTKLINSTIQPENIYYRAPDQGQQQWDFQTLATATLGSLTSGAPKIMFINGDGTDVTYPDTINNTNGYAGVPWDGEKYTVQDMAAQQGPALQNHTEALWSVGWVLGANNTAIIQSVLAALRGQRVWTMQPIATQANSAFQDFLSQYTGGSPADARFNQVVVDWLECGGSPSLPEFIIGLNS